MKEHGLPNSMCMVRHPKVTSGMGDAWFYITPQGIDVNVSCQKEIAAHISFTISRKQLARALQIINQGEKL
jgi:hypothetical protein